MIAVLGVSTVGSGRSCCDSNKALGGRRRLMQAFSDQSGAGVILLVDDESAVRNLLKLYLERNGMQVCTASSGEEALQLFIENSDVKILLTDLVMPGISGRDLAFQIRQLQPSLPILLMSGYADQLSGDSEFDIPCMRKPLDLKGLLEKIVILTNTDSEFASAQPNAA